MEKTKRNKILIALAVLVALIVAFVLYFRFMPAWASVQVVLLSGVAGLVLGFMFRWLYDKYLSGIFPLLWKIIKNLFKGGKDED